MDNKLDLSNLQNKSQKELAEMAMAMDALVQKVKYNKIDTYFTDEGKTGRAYYPKHLEFLAAGARHSIRAFVAANRVGKSVAGAYELVCHLTGRYPHWWEGKRFNKPIKAWACARENKQMREGIQEILFGSFSDKGTGLLRKSDITNEEGDLMTWQMAGSANCIGTCLVNHISGGTSQLDFKTYAQGWQEFQGSKRDVVWLDEEPDQYKIYTECLTRTAGSEGNEGIIYCTFTPLLGFSDLVLSFLPGAAMPPGGIHPETPQKFVLAAAWEDCPHLSSEWKKTALSQYDPMERDARSRGLPSMGSGRIFTVPEEYIKCTPFEIPEYWPRVFGLDFGWHNTAVLWIAQDPTTKCYYVYAEYKAGERADYIHINAIKSKGEWIPGIADPSGGGRKDDGSLRYDDWRVQGLTLYKGNNALTAGIAKLLNLFESDQLKIFSNLEQFLKEYRVYRYDLNEVNKPAKNQNDHLLDALRYAISMFEYYATTNIEPYEDDEEISFRTRNTGRDPLTGY